MEQIQDSPKTDPELYSLTRKHKGEANSGRLENRSRNILHWCFYCEME